MHVDLDHGHRDLQLDTGATAPFESNADKGTLSRGNLLSDFKCSCCPVLAASPSDDQLPQL